MGFSVRAESSASTPVIPAMDLRASWTAVTSSPAFSSGGITFCQIVASANAPWTKITDVCELFFMFIPFV